MNKNQPTKGPVTQHNAFYDNESALKKHPIFDTIVKNFSQMAYINSSGKGLELYPQVTDHSVI